jgi:hypothetical protein
MPASISSSDETPAWARKTGTDDLLAVIVQHENHMITGRRSSPFRTSH